MNKYNITDLLLEAKQLIEKDPAISEKGTNDIVRILSEIELKIKDIVEQRKEKKPKTRLSFGEGRERQDKTESKLLSIVASEAGIKEYGKSITSIINEVERQRKEIFEINSMDAICKRYSIVFRELDGVILPTTSNAAPVLGSGNGFDIKGDRLNKTFSILNILKEIGAYGDDLIIRSGQILPNMMRSQSYVVISVPRINRTFFICENYGEATFVCKGFPTDEELVGTNLDKKQLLNRYGAIKIMWSDDYERWKNNIWNAISLGENSKQSPFEMSAKGEKESFQALPKVSLSYYEEWRNKLLDSQSEFEKVGVVVLDGIWYFSECRGMYSWPKVGGKSLVSYPNSTYNKLHSIGNDRGVIQNLVHLKNMFINLGIRVASDEEEINRYKDILLSEQETLEKELGLKVKDGIWYFSACSHERSWPKIGTKTLNSFPNCTFNKLHSVGNSDGIIFNSKELKKMFEHIGISVASVEQEKDLSISILRSKVIDWRETLLSAKDKLLDDMGLICIDGIWYFSECKGTRYWPKIGGGLLMCYPSLGFNQEYSLGNSSGVIQNPIELKKMFALLDIRVASEEEEALRYKNILLSNQDLLEDKVGLIVKDGIWYFKKCKGMNVWPKINGRGLMSFPNSQYIKLYGIGNNVGSISNPKNLKKMFEYLGIRVATEEEEEKNLDI